MMESDLEPDEAINIAAEWIASRTAVPGGRAIVPTVRSTFGLGVADAMEAIRRAQQLRRARAT